MILLAIDKHFPRIAQARRHLKDLKRAFINAALVYASSITSLLLAYIISHRAGPHALATFLSGLVISSFLIPLGNLGSDRVFAAKCRMLDGRRSRAALHHSNLVRRIIGTAVGVVLGGVYALFSGGRTDDMVALFIVAAWASLQGLYPSAWYDVRKRVKLHNYIVLAERLISLLTVVAILELRSGPSSATVMWAASLLVLRGGSIFVQFYLVYPRERPSRISDAMTTGANWGGSLILTITAISNASVAYGGMLILKENASVHTFNAYAIVFQLLGIVNILQSQVLRLSVPEIARTVATDRIYMKKVVIGARKMILSSGFLVLICWLLTPLVLALLGSDTAALPPTTYFYLYLWVTIYGCGLVVSQYMANDILIKGYAIVSMCGGIITFSMGSVAVPEFGPAASAAILLIVHSSMIGCYIWLIHKYNRSTQGHQVSA